FSQSTQSYLNIEKTVYEGFFVDAQTAVVPEWTVRVAPNPVQNHVQILAQGAEGPLRAQVMDLTGRVLRTEKGHFGRSLSLDLTALPAGVYLLQLDRDGQRWTRRIVRQ
ncbi:MAG: T9SS type A sorting domain-containing protein, partial [Bacteroidota bacterium]